MSLTHYPLHWFADISNQEKVCFILLNCELHGLERMIQEKWQKIHVFACADGGANVLYDLVSGDNQEEFVPNVICGDLDSARTEVIEFYKSKGCDVVKYPDQDDTDFTKTLQHLLDLKKKGTIEFTCVYAMNATWGRFDQTMGNLNTIFSVQSSLPVYLLSEDSLMFVLEPGRHVIHTQSGLEEGHCGLIPVGEKCESCITSGLKWNLCGDQSMKMGGLVSTCNLIAGPKVEVKTTNRLLWTMSHKL